MLSLLSRPKTRNKATSADIADIAETLLGSMVVWYGVNSTAQGAV